MKVVNTHNHYHRIVPELKKGDKVKITSFKDPGDGTDIDYKRSGFEVGGIYEVHQVNPRESFYYYLVAPDGTTSRKFDGSMLGAPSKIRRG